MTLRTPSGIQEIRDKLLENIDDDAYPRPRAFQAGYKAAVEDLRAYARPLALHDDLIARKERIIQLRRAIVVRAQGEGVPLRVERDLAYAEGQLRGYFAVSEAMCAYLGYGAEWERFMMMTNGGMEFR